MSKNLKILFISSASAVESLAGEVSMCNFNFDYKSIESLEELKPISGSFQPDLIIHHFSAPNADDLELIERLTELNIYSATVSIRLQGVKQVSYYLFRTNDNYFHFKKTEKNLKDLLNDFFQIQENPPKNFEVINELKELKKELEEKVNSRTNILLEANEKLKHEILIRKKIEDDLRSTQNFMDTILKHIPNAIYVKDAQTLKFTFINDAVNTHLGYTAEDLIDKTVYEVYSKELADYYTRKDKELLKTKEMFEINEDIFLTKDNRIRIHNAKKLLINDEAGNSKYILDITDDVTDKIRNEKELRRIDMRFSKLFLASPIGIAVIDAVNKKLIDINPKFLSLVGYQKAELVNSEFDKLLFWQDKESISTLFKKITQATKIQNDEKIVISKSGKELTMLLSAEFLQYEGDDPLILLLLLDITQRKQAEEDIRKALETEKGLNILKTRFISMISHEFRTPLTSIMLSTDLLKRYGDQWSDVERTKHFARIQNTVLTMTKLIENVLIIGKLETGNYELNIDSIDIAEFCRTIAENVEQMFLDDKHIVFEVKNESLNAKADENLLNLILTNLLSNAMKYSYKNGIVRFVVSCTDDEMIFQIQDYGIGIPKQDFDHLFDTFHRGSNTSTISGYGLGLAIVKKCVDAQLGIIEFESVENAGTTFTVKIPLLA